MKLYYSPGACSLAPHIILEEIGIEYTTELVSTSDGSTESPAYLSINPRGRVPALDINGRILTEASAIMTYLALTNPESELLNTSPFQLARSIEWMNWLGGIHMVAIALLWRTERFSNDHSAYPEMQAKGMQNLQEACSIIDAKFHDINWAVNNSYSIVDPYLLVFYRWGNRLGLPMREYLHWTKHAEAMEQRPAVKKILRAEEISIWE